jgi:hypothetical protein
MGGHLQDDVGGEKKSQPVSQIEFVLLGRRIPGLVITGLGRGAPQSDEEAVGDIGPGYDKGHHRLAVGHQFQGVPPRGSVLEPMVRVSDAQPKPAATEPASG